MGTVEDRMLAIVEREFGLQKHQIHGHSRLADLGDSLDWVNLLAALEETFNMRISTERSLTLCTVQDLVRLVQEPAHV